MKRLLKTNIDNTLKTHDDSEAKCMLKINKIQTRALDQSQLVWLEDETFLLDLLIGMIK